MVKKDSIKIRISKGQKQDLKKIADLHDMTMSELLRYCFRQKKADLDLSEKHHQLKKQKEELKRKQEKICDEIEEYESKIESVKARLENMERRERQRKEKEREKIDEAVKTLVRRRREGKTWEKIRHFASNQPVVQNSHIDIDQDKLITKVEKRLKDIDKETRKANK